MSHGSMDQRPPWLSINHHHGHPHGRCMASVPWASSDAEKAAQGTEPPAAVPLVDAGAPWRFHGKEGAARAVVTRGGLGLLGQWLAGEDGQRQVSKVQ